MLETQFAMTLIVCLNAGGALLVSCRVAPAVIRCTVHQVSGSPLPTSPQLSVNFVCREPRWIEIAEPVTDLLMSRVIGVLECLEKLSKSVQPAAIFRRTAPLPRHAHLLK